MAGVTAAIVTCSQNLNYSIELRFSSDILTHFCNIYKILRLLYFLSEYFQIVKRIHLFPFWIDVLEALNILKCKRIFFIGRKVLQLVLNRLCDGLYITIAKSGNVKLYAYS